MKKLIGSTVLATLIAAWPAPLSAEVVVVGKFPAKIVPEQAASLTFNTKGTVTDLIKDTSHRIEKDTIVACMDKDKREEEREDMELQLERDRLSKEDEIRKLRASLEKLKFYLSLNEKERTYANDVRTEGDEEAPEIAIKDLERRIRLSERELSTMERRKRAEFDKKHAANTLRMPFTGRLQYNFPLPENLDEPFEFNQISGRAFASVCDDSSFYITLRIGDADLTLLPEERFSASITLPGGKIMNGTFAFRRVEASSGGDMLAYFFKISPDDHETAYSMMGTNASAELLYTPEDEVELVKKIDLLAHPAAAECEDWKQLVAVAHPGCVLVLTTERFVLIRKTNPNAS